MSDIKFHMGAALNRSLLNRMPEKAARCEVVVLTRAELETAMALTFLDGCDAATDWFAAARQNDATLPSTG